jgi:hypothetical protein
MLDSKGKHMVSDQARHSLEPVTVSFYEEYILSFFFKIC